MSDLFQDNLPAIDIDPDRSLPVTPPPPQEAWQFERLPPQAIEQEMLTLASMMLDWRGPMFDEIVAELPVDAFYSPDHQIIYQQLIEYKRSGKPLDLMLFREHLSDRKLLEEIGGTAYLVQMVNMTPSAANGRFYASIVREKWQLREAIIAANEITRLAYDPNPGKSIAETLMDMSNRLLTTASTGRADSIITIGEAVENLMKRIKGTTPLFIPTGLRELDGTIIGLPIGGMTLIAGDSRTGKSLVAKDIARRLAETSKRVGIIALEETDEKIAANVTAAESEIESRDIMRGVLTNEAWTQVEAWAEVVANLPIVIQTNAQTIGDCEQAIALMAIKYKCEVIFIDHFHLIDIGDVRNETAAQSSNSHRLKAAFKRAKVAGVLLSQINKGQDLSNRPNEHSLRGSHALYNDSDMVLLLYCEDFKRMQDYMNTNNGNAWGFEPKNTIEIIVNKNKFGPTGTAIYQINRPFQKLKDREEIVP